MDFNDLPDEVKLPIMAAVGGSVVAAFNHFSAAFKRKSRRADIHVDKIEAEQQLDVGQAELIHRIVDQHLMQENSGNTVVIEHADDTCLLYTHLDKKLIKQGDHIVRGQQIGTIGKGAKNIYSAHLHLDMPRSRTYARARTYYDTAAEVAKRFIDPLNQILASV